MMNSAWLKGCEPAGGSRGIQGAKRILACSFRASCIGVLALLAVLVVSQPAFAQRPQGLAARVQGIEKDLAAIKRYLARGDGAPAAGQPLAGPAQADAAERTRVADVEARIDRLDYELRSLTGRIEEIQHGISLLGKRLEKLVQDTDFRLAALEHAAESGDKSSPPDTATESVPADRHSDNSAAVATEPEKTPRALYSEALQLLRSENYDAAEKSFRTFLDKFGDNSLAANARYWLGETYYVRGDFGNAARVFLEGYEKGADSPKGSSSLLKLGMSLANLGQKDEACAVFREFSSQYTDAAPVIGKRVAAERKKAGCP